jgi:hypothetical protein
MSADEDRAGRARNRAHWVGRRHELGQEPDEDLSATTTMEERLGMMWRLALDAWAWRGEPLPRYDRASIPGRVLRGGDGSADPE